MIPMRSDRDVERYTSPSRFEAEKRVVFRRLPLVVGRTSELPAAGSFFTHDAAGVPLLLTRDPAGEVRAMLNVCTHRGARLVTEERGATESFVCRLHAWRYDLCGQLARPGLTSLPRELEQFIDDRALTSLPCESRHGFLWVVPAARARIDVAGALGESLDAELASLGLADLVEVRREVSTRPGNWKRVVETMLDHARPGAVIPIFPSSMVVADGDSVSHHAVFPGNVDDVTWVHTQLARRVPVTGAEHAALDAAWLHVRETLLREAPFRETEAGERRRIFHEILDRVLAEHPVRGR